MELRQDGDWLDGGTNYVLNVPANAPAEAFWPITLYDVDVCRLIKNEQKIADRSSRMDPLEKNDGSITIYMGPDKPEGEKPRTGFPPWPARPGFPISGSIHRRRRFSTGRGFCRTSRRRSDHHIRVLLRRLTTIHLVTGKRQVMSDGRPQASWRIKVGFAIFVASIGWPILIPILPALGVPATAIAAFSGVMVVAAELMLIAGAAIAGKEGFAFIKARVFGFLRSYGPPREVSRTRYKIGLMMFATPIIFGWASPYFGHLLPGFETRTLIYAVVGDVLLLISLFVLGGAFWDKLRSLFQHNAYASFPGKVATDGKPK